MKDNNVKVCSPWCGHEQEHHHLPVEPAAGFRVSQFIQLSFIVSTLILVIFFRKTPAFATLSITFVSIFLEALPFMLLGSLIGGFIEIFVSRDTLTRLLPDANWQSILLAAGVGIIFPVCECAIIPVVRRLFQKGLPLGAGIAFLLGGPIVNPLVIVSTSVAYGYDWSIACERMVFGYLIAVTIGFLTELFFSKQSALAAGAAEIHDECICDNNHPRPAGFFRKIVSAFHHAAEDFLDIGRYLVFGAFVAGLLQTVIARSDMTAVTGFSIVSILIMMVLAVVLSLCSEADAFVAASFQMTIVPLTAQMAFMVIGPMLDIKLILMYFRIFRRRFIFVLSAMTFFIVFVSMIVKFWSSG